MEELENRAQDVMGQMMEAAQKTNDGLKQNAVEKDQKEETGRPNEKKDEEDSEKPIRTGWNCPGQARDLKLLPRYLGSLTLDMATPVPAYRCRNCRPL